MQEEVEHLENLYEVIDQLERALDEDRFYDDDEEAMNERLQSLNEEADDLADRLIANESRAA